MTVTPAWTVKDLATGFTYTADETGSSITYRVNHPSEAVIQFNNSDSLLNTAFNAEDEVVIIINGITMFDGYIYNLEDTWYPNRRKDLKLYIMDWGSYLASKTIFERDYQLTKYCKDLLLDGAAKVAGLSTGGVDLVGLGSSNFQVKGRRFQGTYVKDVWYMAAETGGFDYYVDELKTLQAWPFEDTTDGSGVVRLLQTGGNNYQIVDFVRTQYYQMIVRQDKFNQMWSQDVQNKYRSVTIENGLIETLPAVIDNGSSDSVHPKGYSYELSLWYSLQTDVIFDGGTGTTPVQKPFDIVSSENLGSNFNLPSIHLFVGSSSASIVPTFQPRSYTASQITLNFINMAQAYNAWQKVGFFINVKNLTGVTITQIQLQLNDFNSGGYFYRNIQGDFTIANGWIYLEYNLPTSNTNPSNGWSISGTPNNIDFIQFGMTPASGYNVGSHIDFAAFNLWRIAGATITGAGSPATQQIIFNKNITDPVQIRNYAIRSQLRSNLTKQGPQVTIDPYDRNGNFVITDFKRPGYKLNIDLTASFGSGRVANNLRMDEIKHILDNGFHYCTITFDNSFYRP